MCCCSLLLKHTRVPAQVYVPKTVRELCSSQVLCSEFVEGVAIDKVTLILSRLGITAAFACE